MVNILIIDSSSVREEEILAYTSPSPEADALIKSTASETERQERYAAYRTLDILFPELVKTIVYTNGKPSFEKCHPVFNFSHSNGVVALAYSYDFSEIGVDLQAEPKRRGVLERVAERFLLSKGKEKETSGEELVSEVKFYTLSGEKLAECDEDSKPHLVSVTKSQAKRDLLIKWTLLEAVLKMSGDGVSAYGKAEDIENEYMASTESYVFEKDGKYALSVAFSRRKM